ncbi:MAG: hypothetical protein V7765_16600 [Oleispira sp.]
MEATIVDLPKESAFLDIIEDRSRLEALLEKSNNLFGVINTCPRIKTLFNARGSKKEKEYYKYSTEILMDLMEKEFNKKINHITIQGLTELRITMLIDKSGLLEKLTLSDLHRYGPIKYSVDYVNVQKILERIQYKFKQTIIQDECGKYEIYMTARWKMPE